MDEPIPLFDGKTFAGWEGDTKSTWRIEDGALVGGSLDRKQANNDFLATVKEYGNFELTLEYELEGKEGFINGGVQFRSQRVPHSSEVCGYQADLGMGYDGAPGVRCFPLMKRFQNLFHWRGPGRPSPAS